MSRTLQINCEPCLNDVKETHRHLVCKQFGVRSIWQLKLRLIALCLAGNLLVLGLSALVGDLRGAYALPIVTLVMFLLFWARNAWNWRKWKTKLESEDTVTCLEISSAGMRFQTSTADTFMPWIEFTKFDETPNLYLVHDRRQLVHHIPKRAFPDDQDRDWFYALATNSINTEAKDAVHPPLKTVPTRSDTIRLRYDFGRREVVALTWASWYTWVNAFIAFVMMCGVFVFFIFYVYRDVNGRQLLLAFSIPLAACVAIVGCMPVTTKHNWEFWKKYSGNIEAYFSENGLKYSLNDNSFAIDWSHFQYYKETSKCFILWRREQLFVVPRTAFESVDDVDRFEALLRKNLTHTWWFCGKVP